MRNLFKPPVAILVLPAISFAQENQQAIWGQKTGDAAANYSQMVCS